jgi:hypothetical protein
MSAERPDVLSAAHYDNRSLRNSFNEARSIDPTNLRNDKSQVGFSQERVNGH